MKTIITNRQQLQKIISEISEEDFEKGFILEISSIKKWKTDKQNRTFHSLLYAFFDSGYSSYDNVIDLKNHYKEEMGMDIDYYVYFLKDEVFNSIQNKKYPKAHKVEKIEDLPKSGIVAVNKIYKSFSLATEKQVINGIKSLIRDIFLSGASIDLKIQEILKGLGEFLPSTDDLTIENQISNIFPGAKIIKK